MAIRRISFLDNFLSGGWVGTSFRSSANAPDTFCWRQRSLVLVNIFRTTVPLPMPNLVPARFSTGRTAGVPAKELSLYDAISSFDGTLDE